ncbi:MAG TPA: DUF4328 domain-containing protein [Novosphingobium sp.]|nr:DUF4328 domain-containing protein [Novosphingobium sp.]
MAELGLYEGLALLQRRAGRARVAIYAFAATFSLMAACEAARAAGIIDLDVPGPVLLPAVGVYLSSSVAYLTSVVFIAMWLYRAHANLVAAGVDGLEFSPGWSVGWYFIPIANLFKPFQAMRELWTNSHNIADGFGAEAPHQLSLWWGTFIVGNMLTNMSSRFDNREGASANQVGAMLDLLGALTIVACSIFLLRIIRDVTGAQQSIVGLSKTFA